MIIKLQNGMLQILLTKNLNEEIWIKLYKNFNKMINFHFLYKYL